MTPSDNQSPGNITVWRKGWDSNPRTGSSPITRFRVERVTASSLPFHKRVLYTKTGPRASLFSGALPQTTARALSPAADAAKRPRAAAGYRRSRTPCASRAFSPSGSPAASGQARSLPAPLRIRLLAPKKKTRFQKADPFSNVLQIGAGFRRSAAASASIKAEVCGVRPCRRAAAL